MEQAAAPEVLAGVYYYPWYISGETQQGASKWDRAMRLHLKPPQLPALGRYDSNDPGVMGGHIDQSERGGIGFWAVSWWGADSPTDRNFREVILPHPQAGRMRYAILYESTGRLGSFSQPDYRKWEGDLAYLKKHYFGHPYYLRIGGRPVLFVYLTREYFRNRGGEALELLREKYPEVYLVGDDVFFQGGAGEYQEEWARSFDAVTAYDVYGQSVGPLGGTEKAVETLAANYAQAKAAAKRAGAAFLPAIAPGYNDTAVRQGHPGRARYFTDRPDSREGDIFRAMIRQAGLPNVDAAGGNILMVTSFNEWYEDSQIEPTAGRVEPSSGDNSESGTKYTGGQRYEDYGTLYLDILREELLRYQTGKDAP